MGRRDEVLRRSLLRQDAAWRVAARGCGRGIGRGFRVHGDGRRGVGNGIDRCDRVAGGVHTFDQSFFARDGDGLFDGFGLLGLHDVDLFGDDPLLFDAQDFGDYGYDERGTFVAHGLRTINDAIGLDAADFGAGGAELLLEQLIMSVDALGYADAARDYRNGARMDFFADNGNDDVRIAPVDLPVKIGRASCRERV